MKKTLLFVSIITVFSFSLKAQEYKTGVGIRLGPSSPAIAPGFTIRHFLDEKHAVEGIVGINSGIGVCALYEWFQPVATIEHLQWFVGAGRHYIKCMLDCSKGLGNGCTCIFVASCSTHIAICGNCVICS